MPLRRRSQADRHVVRSSIFASRSPPFFYFIAFYRRYHGKTQIKDGGRYKTSLTLDQKLYHMARLEISNVENSDGGEYRAVAKNTHGEGVATINLNFEGGEKPK